MAVVDVPAETVLLGGEVLALVVGDAAGPLLTRLEGGGAFGVDGAAARLRKLFQQRDAQPGLRGRECRRLPGGAAADHHEVVCGIDGQVLICHVLGSIAWCW